MVWRIMADLGNYQLGTSLTYQSAWRLPSTPADCASIARFVQYVCQVTGVPGQFYATNYAAAYRTTQFTNWPTQAQLGSLSKKNASGEEEAYVHPGTFDPALYGSPISQGLNTNWTLALADANCRPFGRENDASAPTGEVGCYRGLNSFEAALIYTDLAGKAWYLPAGVSGDPIYENKDAIVQIFKTMVWVALEDHDGDPTTATVLVVKKVEYRYTRQPDAILCPP